MRKLLIPALALVACGGAEPAVNLLWLSDSIYDAPEIQGAVAADLPGMSVEQTPGTYWGTVEGTGLMEVADSTQAYEDGGWTSKMRGTPFSDYDGVVFEYLRNDADRLEGVSAYRRGYDKLLAQAVKYFPTVVAGDSPPLANSDLTAWDLSHDPAQLGYLDAVHGVADKWGVAFVDTYQDFQDLVSSGADTVPQLMRDTLHPTLTAGADELGKRIAASYQNQAALRTAAMPEISGTVVNYLFGQPISGTWALTALTPNFAPRSTPLQRIAGLPSEANVAEEDGATLRFPDCNGSQVWAHFLIDPRSGGTANIYVDRGTANERAVSFDTLVGTTEVYPRSVLVADELSDGSHTVEIITADALPVRVLGITCVGAH
jgi:hypothetical protein